MTSSNNEANVAANTTLVAATPVIEAESPDSVLSPWDSEIVDLLEEVADNTDRLANDASVQVTEPTAETPSSVALPVVEHTTSVTVVPEAAQLSTPANVTENQPQPTVVAETPAEAGQQHSLAGLQNPDSTSNPAQTTPLPVNSDSAESSRHTSNHRSEGPIRLANGQFASQAQLSTPFGKMLTSMSGDKNDLMGYALGGALWPVAKEAMGLMQHAQGLFRRPSPSTGSNANTNANNQTTSNTNNSHSTNHTTHAANTSASREQNTTNATHTAANSEQSTTSATHTAASSEQHTANITHAGSTTPSQPSATNDQHPNQPDTVQATPETPQQAASDQPSLGQQQQVNVSEQALQTQQQQSENNQLERQTFALITEERTTQQLLKDIKNNLAQQADSCCGCADQGETELDLDGDRRNRRQSSDSRDNPRRQNKWLAKAGKLAKFGGPLAGVITATATYQALKDREDLTTTQKAVQVGASTTGAMGGAAAGAMAGASLGSVVPIIGTAIGGLLGGLVGGVAGSWLGDEAGKAASDYLAQKPATSTVQPIEASQAEQALDVDHSELIFETDKLVVNNTTSQSYQGRISNHTSTVAEPSAAAVTLPSLPAEPVPLTTDNNQRTNTEGQLPANQLATGLPPPPITLDEQKLGQALAKSLQQLPTERTAQQTYRSHSAPSEFSSIPTEFDDVVLTLMSHDRI